MQLCIMNFILEIQRCSHNQGHWVCSFFILLWEYFPVGSVFVGGRFPPSLALRRERCPGSVRCWPGPDPRQPPGQAELCLLWATESGTLCGSWSHEFIWMFCSFGSLAVWWKYGSSYQVWSSARNKRISLLREESYF